eukprot:15322956-Alexandrium_andersonii.AAC.1
MPGGRFGHTWTPTSLGASPPGGPRVEGYVRAACALKHWSVTPKTIALSFGEAELAGIVKGAAEGLGIAAGCRPA